MFKWLILSRIRFPSASVIQSACSVHIDFIHKMQTKTICPKIPFHFQPHQIEKKHIAFISILWLNNNVTTKIKILKFLHSIKSVFFSSFSQPKNYRYQCLSWFDDIYRTKGWKKNIRNTAHTNKSIIPMEYAVDEWSAKFSSNLIYAANSACQHLQNGNKYRQRRRR